MWGRSSAANRRRTGTAGMSPGAAAGVAEVNAWSRRRLLAILGAAVAVAVLLVMTLGYGVFRAVSGTGPAAVTDGAGEDFADGGPGRGLGSEVAGGLVKVEPAEGDAHRDEIAAAAMLEVPEDAMYPADPDTQPAATVSIPEGRTTGPANILTGFPHTPAGAVAQLAQLDVAALSTMSLPVARAVHQAWALPGGATADSWWVTRSVEAFLTSTSMGQVMDPQASVTVDPAAAIFKGTDGPDWATVCVLLKVHATFRQDTDAAVGHCERMQWVGGRWMIAPGTPPALAPSTWPGTALANEAGWLTWTPEQDVDEHLHENGGR